LEGYPNNNWKRKWRQKRHTIFIPFLQSEHYQFRNSIVTTIGNILVNFNEYVTRIENKDIKNSENNEGVNLTRRLYMQNNRD
jgi:hypothetical protein